jgi:hypothetical protein
MGIQDKAQLETIPTPRGLVNRSGIGVRSPEWINLAERRLSSLATGMLSWGRTAYAVLIVAVLIIAAPALDIL